MCFIWGVTGQSCHPFFIDTAANILGLSASLLNSFFPPFVTLHEVPDSCFKKSQQHLTFGCQLKEETNYFACI